MQVIPCANASLRKPMLRLRQTLPPTATSTIRTEENSLNIVGWVIGAFQSIFRKEQTNADSLFRPEERLEHSASNLQPQHPPRAQLRHRTAPSNAAKASHRKHSRDWSSRRFIHGSFHPRSA